MGYKTKLKNKIFNFLSLDPVFRLKVLKLRNLERIGTHYGGWVIPGRYLNKDSVCYCAGAGEDVSFDAGIAAKYNCNVYIFDPTPRARLHFDTLRERTINGEKMPINNSAVEFYELSPLTLQKVHFFDTGIWDKDTVMKFYAPQNPSHVSHSTLNIFKSDIFFEAKVDRLSNIIKNLGHQKIDLLKLDIEGAEYKVIDSIINDGLDVKILCVEFDEFNKKLDDGYLVRIKDSLLNLYNFGFVLANVDGTNYTLIKKSEFSNHRYDK